MTEEIKFNAFESYASRLIQRLPFSPIIEFGHKHIEHRDIIRTVHFQGLVDSFLTEIIENYSWFKGELTINREVNRLCIDNKREELAKMKDRKISLVSENLKEIVNVRNFFTQNYLSPILNFKFQEENERRSKESGYYSASLRLKGSYKGDIEVAGWSSCDLWQPMKKITLENAEPGWFNGREIKGEMFILLEGKFKDGK